MRIYCIIFCLVGIAIYPSLADAQITEDSVPTQVSHVQVEAGVDYVFVQEPTTQHAIGGLNLVGRLGVSDFAELRLGLPNIAFEDLASSSDTMSFGEVMIGARLGAELTERFMVGVIPQMGISAQTGHLLGGVLGTADFGLTDDIMVGANLGLNVSDAGQQWASEGFASAAVAWAADERVGLYLESFAVATAQDTTVFGDIGVTYVVADWLESELYVGVQLPEASSLISGMALTFVL
ncbi:MAG: hypothetical protein ACLFVJ_04630 [Persicimonas sp.]